MASDTQGPAIPDPAEATDGSEFGEEAGDESLPGTVGFPPTSPSGVGPAGSLADPDRRDSVGQRSEREEPEGWSTPREPVVLLDPNASGEPDDESEMLAEDVPPVGLISPEEAAVHVESE